jgi:hypothetical protein
MTGKTSPPQITIQRKRRKSLSGRFPRDERAGARLGARGGGEDEAPQEHDAGEHEGELEGGREDGGGHDGHGWPSAEENRPRAQRQAGPGSRRLSFRGSCPVARRCLPSTRVVFTRPVRVWPDQGELLRLAEAFLGIVVPFFGRVEEAEIGGGAGCERAGGQAHELGGGFARHQVDDLGELELVCSRTSTPRVTASAVSRPRMPLGA